MCRGRSLRRGRGDPRCRNLRRGLRHLGRDLLAAGHQSLVEIVAKMLRPGGSLYLADGHPAALVLDDAVAASDGTPGFYTPYFSRDPVIYCESEDYIVGETTFKNGEAPIRARQFGRRCAVPKAK